MTLPHSFDVERIFLASIIKHKSALLDYIEHLSDEMFFSDIHKIIASAIRFQFKAKKEVDAIILSDHIKNIGLSNHEDTDIPDYIRTIVLRNSVNEDSVNKYFKELFKYKIARGTILSCRAAEIEINKSINGTAMDVVNAAEKHLSKAATTIVEDEYSPVDIYKDMDVFLEDLGEKKGADGILTPFKTWNKWWGALTKGDLTVIAAPPKTGKSTILNYIADAPFCKYNNGRKIKVLILDTELETERVRSRKAAALSNIKEHFIKTGKWQDNTELTEKVTSQFNTFKKREGSIKHLYVANVPIETICRIVKRWKATDTEEGDLLLVVYDYLKITGENITNYDQEWQVLGRKCDTLKHLMSEVGAAGLCAVQTNSNNDVAASQRIKWFASQVLFFTKKSPEEISEDGEEFGTHYLKPFVLRNEGESWQEEMYVKEQKKDGVIYHPNRLNLTVSNFDMKESGTLAQVISKKEEQIDIEEDDTPPWKKSKKIKVEEDLL